MVQKIGRVVRRDDGIGRTAAKLRRKVDDEEKER
jgi:hypothetical protein